MANSNTSILTTDFNVYPYYDDYDETKKYVRILYKPSYAVQGRELTQMQTMQQKQIDRFGKHIFRDGSIVLHGESEKWYAIENNLPYVKIKDTDNVANDVIVMNFVGKTVTQANNGLQAVVMDALDGTETDANTKTLYVRYLNSGTGGQKVFVANELITANDNNTVISLSSTPTGDGTRFTILDHGVLFAKEHFIRFDTQSIIASRYSTSPNCKIGFIITEDIVTAQDDATLLDPALGASNYAAPGADRLRLTPTLYKYDDPDAEEDADYVNLLTLRNGVIEKIFERPTYNILRDELAKRTFDESGDYYVRGLNVRIQENLDDGENEGYSATGNSQLLTVIVDPGLAYVKGYEVEVPENPNRFLTTEKGLLYSNINNQIVTTSQGNYLTVDEYVGPFDLNEGTLIELWNTPQNRISNLTFSSAAQTGTKIGEARIKTFEYDSNDLGTANGRVNLFLFDIRMLGSNSFSNVRSVYYNSGATIACGDAVLSGNSAVLQDTGVQAMLYSVGSPAVRTIRDSSGAVDTLFTAKRTQDVTIAADGTVSVTIGTPGEIYPYGASATLSDTSRQLILLNLNADRNTTTRTGTVTGVNGSNVVTGSGTAFTRLNVEDYIIINGISTRYKVEAITSDSSLNVTPAITSSSISGNTYVKTMPKGVLLDLTKKGSDDGAVRAATTSSNTVMTIDTGETASGTTSATVTYYVTRNGAREATKVLVPNRYVRINVANAAATTAGPFTLGYADVYQIRGIWKQSGSQFTSEPASGDVSSNFNFDNGQRDSYYEFASITPRNSGYLANGDHLLVKFDAFVPVYSSGVGYFSVDSYPINDNATSNSTIKTEDIPVYRSPTTGFVYDLRNYLDFRPVKTNTAANTDTVTSATVSPSVSGGFFTPSDGGGLRIPASSEQVVFDYSYYLPRRDLVTIDKDGNLAVIMGRSTEAPVTPATPINTMALAKIFIPPYPSLAPNYAQTIGRQDLAAYSSKLSNIRHTMRDIGVIKSRVVNLEYYASLNALERDALDYRMIDENGLDRFKNGIFIDNFRDHSLGAIYSEDYKIVVDKDEKSIRPIFTMESFYYDNLANTNVVINSGLATLPYTETTLIEQPNATTIRNIEVSSYRFIGNLYLNPETDVWVDTQYLPDNAITLGPDVNEFEGGSLGTEWNAWQTTIVGYNLRRADNGKLLATFDANERDLAYQNAYVLARNAELNQNTIGFKGEKISTIVETVKAKTRTGTESFSAINETTENSGDKVVDVSLIPYIRPQVIHMNGRGLKANTTFYTFFDGVDMTDYVTPFTPTVQQKALLYQAINDETGPLYPADAGAVDLGVRSGAEGDPLVSDANGEVFGSLRLPSDKHFRVGGREVKITDSPTNAEDATSAASYEFFASGLVQQKQDTIITTRQIYTVEKDVVESKTVTQQYVQQLRPSCTAYAFHVKAPENQEGVFVTSFDIFVARKHPTLGVWFELREMDSAGGITRKQVPYSEVWLESSEITADADTPTAMNVRFPAPVFLYNDTQYALVIHTVGINPDTYFWVSRLAETDVTTGKVVTSRPLSGTLYTTNNNLNWDIVPDVDLKVKIYRAAFDTGVTGTLILGNKPVEKLVVKDETNPLNSYGETIIGNDVLTLSYISGGTIGVSNVITGNSSGANTYVTAVSGTNIISMANTGYTVGENVLIRHANSVPTGYWGTVGSIKTGTGTLHKYTTFGSNNRAHLIGSNGNFMVGDVVRGRFSGFKANVESFDNFRYSVVDFEPSYLNFSKTTTAFEMRSTSNTGTLSGYFQINENENYFFGDEQAIYGRYNEIDSFSGRPSNNVKVTMATTSEYLSPVFDIGRTHTIYVDNLVNSNTSGETGVSGGALLNKYISKTITLAEGQDAEDLEIILTAYRPPDTDVLVYVKLLNGEDGDTINQKPWIQMTPYNTSIYSSLADRNDFREFSYSLPAASLSGPLGEVQYNNESGITFTGYKHFAIKIGLSANNSAIVPRVGDLRAIALQI